MAPTRLASKPLTVNENLNGILTRGITTRSKHATNNKIKDNQNKLPGKRKASPMKENISKRAAFGDITNAIKKPLLNDKEKIVTKKVTIETKVLPSVKVVKQSSLNGSSQLNGKLSKTKQIQKAAVSAFDTVHKSLIRDPLKAINKVPNGILKNAEKLDSSQDSRNSSKKGDETGESLYVSALDTISPQDSKDLCNNIIEKLDKVAIANGLNTSYYLQEEIESPHTIPDGVVDFDKDNWDDPFQVSHYAMDIFNYLKRRESTFPIDNYMERQKEVTSWMRSLLVDWMVEVQESFELNHETLYLAVKLVDLYLCKENAANKDQLQLVGASALFIASKFDERIPPHVDDFIYICDGAYTLNELLKMEIKILKVIDFDLGIPLSYRFLRRYARCARVSMPLLTLARYILELCLLEYSVIHIPDSKMAAASLYLALRMKHIEPWTPTLSYYTGYKLNEILPIVKMQNAILHRKPKEAIRTVRNKYSHKIFFEVAKIKLIDDADLTS